MVKNRQCQQPNLPEEPMQTEKEDDSLHASFNVELPFDIPSDVEEEERRMVLESGSVLSGTRLHTVVL
ncbi:uncharacterized protein LOC143051596 isoform X2 [Mytilus galloprovincialis]|uniref:uncharacterized protein LOC143051596 isoform X2 n=1 Tax=Mytilus galloprovincialis TaxID=29158 RepID=UPI003F7C5DD8